MCAGLVGRLIRGFFFSTVQETPTPEHITEALCDRQDVLGSDFHFKLGIMEAAFGRAQYQSLLSEYGSNRPWWKRDKRNASKVSPCELWSYRGEFDISLI